MVACKMSLVHFHESVISVVKEKHERRWPDDVAHLVLLVFILAVVIYVRYDPVRMCYEFVQDSYDVL